MKFTVLQQDLLPPLQTVSRSVGIRSQLPVLDNILLEALGKKLKIAATNLEIGVIKTISVEVLEEGQVTVPAKTIFELVSGLGQGNIEIEADAENVTILSGKLKAQINGISASEFPAIPTSKEAGISFPKDALASCGQILFAAALDEGRPVLTGVLTEVKDGKLDFVATDGFRLAHRQIYLPQKNSHFKSLIPKRTFEEVLRILEEEEIDDVEILPSSDQNQIIFTLGSTIVSSRLIEGQFPAWEKIIPQKILARTIVTREEFLKAIKLASIFAKNEANIVVLKILKDLISLKSSTKELGSQENEVEAQVEGEEFQIAFNAKFLQDAISAAPSQQIALEFSGPLSACMIKPLGVEGLEYIVMPVRLS